MMNRILLMVLCGCLGAVSLKAQPGRLLLTGSVYNPADGLASYLVSFTVTNGNVTGYSVTDYKNNNPLRTPITGRLEPSGRLYLRELPSEESSGLLAGTFCYFTAMLNLSVSHGVRTWNGTYTSHRANGSPCNGGNMTLSEETPKVTAPSRRLPDRKPVLPVPKPVQTPPALPVMRNVPSAAMVLLPVPDRPERRSGPLAPPQWKVARMTPPLTDTPQYQPLYLWNTDSLVLQIWDGYWQDGDAVSISWNGRLVRDVFTMGREPVRLVLPLEGAGINTLSIFLAEDGGEQAITPNAIFRDGPDVHQLNISGNKGQTANIYFRKRQAGEANPPK